jgi:hypothetical protein
MARIAFFTEKLPPDQDPVANFAYDLIRSLADQSHEIRVYSTYRPGAELPPSHPRIQILRPFKNWGWLEVPALLPLLFDFRPEVMHFIQPRSEALRGLTNAMSAITGFAPLLGRPAVVSSFYDFHRRDVGQNKILLAASDVVTVSNEPQSRLLTEFIARSPRKQSMEVALLPVPAVGVREFAAGLGSDAGENEGRDAAEAPWPSEFGAGKAIVFIPGDVSDHVEPALLFAELGRVLRQNSEAAVAFGGGWGSIWPRERHRLLRALGNEAGGRFLLTGPLSEHSERRAFADARLVFTGSLPPESLGLARWLRDALEASAPIVISHEQARIDPMQWRHGENALITELHAEGWSSALLSGLSSASLLDRIRSRLPEFSRLEAVDRPGNVMSRIYARLLDRRKA